MEGNAGNDSLRGGSGDDVLLGGQGNDQSWGGLGNDTFVVALDGSRDIVRDFQAGAGAGDKLDLSALLNVNSLSELGSRLHADKLGNAVVEIGGGASVTLTGVAVGQLAADDFVFAPEATALGGEYAAPTSDAGALHQELLVA
jgi:Ca2+-binding RTX toxin-like protein